MQTNFKKVKKKKKIGTRNLYVVYLINFLMEKIVTKEGKSKWKNFL